MNDSTNQQWSAASPINYAATIHNAGIRVFVDESRRCGFTFTAPVSSESGQYNRLMDYVVDLMNRETEHCERFDQAAERLINLLELDVVCLGEE